MKRSGVYILRSLKTGRYYVGSTDDIERRLATHNRGYVASTKRGVPFELAIFLPCITVTEAKKAEFRLKSYKRKDILDKVIKDGTFPWEHLGP